ncbi:hypothetical protein [Nesterenkonia haasae]|uniref:hypothetical protein n=1 Tax=Nesterenkonia haasae TaxID=2587813 RepID=UPI001391AA87|nr:hypothetical protein [Nesterenkonia haasae]NDK31139.1 hypothetical protein [Nesterenkonia haasae]
MAYALKPGTSVLVRAIQAFPDARHREVGVFRWNSITTISLLSSGDSSAVGRRPYAELWWCWAPLRWCSLIPGLLLMVSGFALLATRYTWVRNWLLPLKARAIRVAIKGVRTWPRIAGSTVGALCLTALGVLWVFQLPVPEWWPLDQAWWLVDDWDTGVTLNFSATAALALVAYSYHRFL